MKNLLSTFLFSLFFMGSISAQNFSHPVAPAQSKERPAALGTLNIFAVMVEFQKDNSSNTFGDGTFGSIYSKDYGNEIIDPLPHNDEYFKAHLSFAKDYFNKASDGKLDVVFDVMPTVIKVSKTMLDYTPPIDHSDLTPLGNFAQEVWQIADENFSIDFSQYDMFVIFHAGAGRDVNLPGSLGLERDLPSVYLGSNSLKNIFGESFDGFPVNNGSFKINNTAILPETESRELNVIGGSVLIELSINGLIVANIASHLGLPDLFDTETGKSAIGRFGLMDGQAIFAYGGLFPPMLSAWEKIYLGWAEPVYADRAGLFMLKASTGIVKIPINATEYYLIENRNRDVNKDGAILSVWENDTVVEKKFPKDTDGFYSYDISQLQGVVTAVDEYDWALPGNGVVIWHIDQNVIDEKLEANKINNDKKRRGVDVEEADGIQDIGEEFQTIFGDVVIGEGDSLDFWYAGNPAELYSNKFDQYSKPNTNSNDGGRSLVSLYDFSPAGASMTFTLNFYADNLERFSHIYLPSVSVDDYRVFSVSDTTFAFISAGRILEQSILFGGSKFLRIAGDFTPAFFNLGQDMIIAAPYNNFVNILLRTPSGSVDTSIVSTDYFSTPPVWNFNADQNELNLFCGTANGNIEKFTFNKNSRTLLNFISSEKFFQDTIKTIALSGDYYIVSSGNEVKNNFGDSQTFDSEAIKIALTQKSSGEFISVILTENGKLYIADDKLNVELIAEGCGSFAIGDIKNDAENHIVYRSGDKLFSLSLSGGVDEGFPFVNPLGINFDKTPLIAELNGDEFQDILIADAEGNIFVLNGSDGRVIKPFPVSTGSPLLTNMTIFVNKLTSSETNSMAVPLKSGDVFFWNINGASVGTFSWISEFGEASNASFLAAPNSGSKITEFFPDAKIYNWPNPVYGNSTFIHYYVAEDSDIEINIFDLSGNLVEKLKDRASGGFESETKWVTSGIQSGVYFAHVKAKSVSGKSKTKIIKIAVIH